MNSAIKKIILARTDSLGDVLLTLPMAGYLKSKWKKTEIYFIGKNYTKPLIESCSYIDHFIDKNVVLQDLSILERIKAEAIVFIYPDRELMKLASKVKIPVRIGTSHNFQSLLYNNKFIHFTRKKSDLHEAQLNFKLLKPLGIETEINLEDIPQYYGLNKIERVPTYIQKLIDKDKFRLIIHPKSKGSAKEWGLDNYYQLIQALPSEKFQVFITGVQEEGDLIRQQKPEIFQVSSVIDLTGKLSLQELISFISVIDGLFANSTGPLHIAAALGKYALGIYQPMRPAHPGRWRPVGKNGDYLMLDKVCNACRNKPGCACIEGISVNKVKNKLMAFASGRNEY